MTFAKSYEPGDYESDIYAAWEADGAFEPTVPKYPIDNDGNGRDDREEGRPEDPSSSDTLKGVRPSLRSSEKESWPLDVISEIPRMRLMMMTPGKPSSWPMVLAP